MDVEKLLGWYRERRRDLPWRRDVSPYRTLVSEFMLQQTRVDTVIPYFDRFMQRFPSVHSLAEAPAEAVLEAWAGLGYYRRARNLHAAAQAVQRLGAFPESAEGLRKLPGIGPYTAGAIASIAMGQPEPVVDGNVERLLCRHDRIDGRGVARQRQLWARARALLPVDEAGDFNQALMELGATVCTPRRPACLVCPVASSCLGKDRPEAYPSKDAARPVPGGLVLAAVVHQADKILLVRRNPGGLLGDLWEPPGGPAPDIDAMVGLRLGTSVAAAEEKATVRHIFTHLKLDTRVFLVELGGAPSANPDNYTDLRWCTVEEAEGMAISTYARKLLRAAGLPIKRSTPRAEAAPQP